MPTVGEDFVVTVMPAVDLVYNPARRLVHRPGDAEDLAQDTLTRPWESWTRGTRPDSVPAWLSTTCLNLARDRGPRCSVSTVGSRHLRSGRRLAPPPMSAVRESSLRPIPAHLSRERRSPMADPTHDPEASAAAYLAGDLCGAGRAEFEAYLSGCEACWEELRAARDGRALAESLRESAPQAMREYLRTVVAAQPDGNVNSDVRGGGLDGHSRGSGRGGAHRSWLSLAAAVIVGAVVAGGATLSVTGSERGADQQALVAAAQVYRAPGVATERTGRPPVAQLGDLRWQGTSSQASDGRPATIYRYGDGSGGRLLLVISPTLFPGAKNAEPVVGTSRPPRSMAR